MPSRTDSGAEPSPGGMLSPRLPTQMGPQSRLGRGPECLKDLQVLPPGVPWSNLGSGLRVAEWVEKGGTGCQKSNITLPSVS